MHAENIDIVQFASAVYYCSEEEGKAVDVDIIRLGEEDNACSVCFETVDVSATAGVKYVQTQGELHFESGEFFKTISALVFMATLEFQVQLSNPKGAVLGTKHCRILIADDDSFPTNKNHDVLLQGRIEEISGGSLMLEYFRMAFSDRALRKAAFWNGLTDQYTNVTFVWQVFMNRILIDSVLTSPPVQAFYSAIFPESRSGKAILLVVLMVLPHLLIVFLYRLKAQRRIMGMATNQLRLVCNIIFGSEDPADHKPSRVLRICQRLGLKPEVLNLVETASKAHRASAHQPSVLKAKATGSAASVVLREAKGKMMRGMHSFPFTEQCLLNLCRAFVMNPEVLILHKPLENFNLMNARRVLELLRTAKGGSQEFGIEAKSS
eukprot:Skav231351  [mRNA]  locus=scaffold1586:2413:15749:- [translate_table: standard]